MQYFRRVIKPESDDLVVLYSDGASESVDSAGIELGRDGLMSLAEVPPPNRPRSADRDSRTRWRPFAAAALRSDDQTVIVLRAL